LVIDVQDVAVRVFEPGGLKLSSDVDVAFALEAGDIIVLKRNTRHLKAMHNGLHFVADAPSCGCGFVGASKLRLVDMAQQAATFAGELGHMKTRICFAVSEMPALDFR
jgi:hypothetical protein